MDKDDRVIACNQRIFVVIVYFDNKYFLLADRKDGTIVAFQNAEEVTRFYGETYADISSPSYERHMSHVVHWLQFNMAATSFETGTLMLSQLFPSGENIRIYTLSSVSGRMDGILIENQELAGILHKEGMQPQLTKILEEGLKNAGKA